MHPFSQSCFIIFLPLVSANYCGHFNVGVACDLSADNIVNQVSGVANASACQDVSAVLPGDGFTFLQGGDNECYTHLECTR